MSDIFQEVDEALRQEKLAKIWQEYQIPIIAGLMALILGTAAITGFNSWNTARNAAETRALLSAIESNNTPEKLANFVKDTRDNHAAIASLNQANFMLEQGQNDEAAAIYTDLAGQRGTDKDLRDLARILAVRHSAAPDTDLLTPVLNNSKSPWIWHARIEAALLAAHQDNDFTKALSFLDGIEKDNSVSASLKQRANALKNVYSYRSQQQ